jgi:uncharacterized protein (TIGR02594 family)
MTYQEELLATVTQRLAELGYTGTVEEATTAFKDKHNFIARPYPGPLTLALLFSEDARPAVMPKPVRPPWFEEMHSKLGLHERDNNAELRAWLASDGSTVGNPAAIAWCGDGVETSIRKTLPDEPIPVNPFLAMNWLKAGRPLSVPALGAILVFHTGNPASPYGHTGFYAGEDATTYHVLGANQSDAVTFTRIAKSRLRKGGIRWPLTYPLPTEGPVSGSLTGGISTSER